MLRGEGTYILPDNVPANEFLNLEGDKISTSRNWAVWLHEYLEAFPGKQDVLRYVLTSNSPETKDNDFTWKDFQAKNNNELVAIFGNFINRTLVLTHKYFDGMVPVMGDLSENDRQTMEGMKAFPGKISQSLHNYRFREGLMEMMNLARLGNKYLTDNEPWKTYPGDVARTGTILNISLQICAGLSIVSEPFLPFTAKKMRKMFGLPELKWRDAQKGNWLEHGHKLGTAELLFEKIEDERIDVQIRKLMDTKKSNETAQPALIPGKQGIEYDDFGKMDIRAGTILEAEKVAKTKKLLKLKIDTGVDIRTVVSGIAEDFTPEEIIGRRVCILINLAPRNLKGIESKGMILMAENPDGKLYFVTPDEGTLNGSSIK